MSNFQLVKRATIGQNVKADVSGVSDWVYGSITQYNKTHIWFNPSDGSDEVKIIRSDIYKATKAEVEEFANPSEPVKEVVSDSDDRYEELENFELEEEIDDDSDEDGEEKSIERIKKYEYGGCVAHSGRSSKNNGDKVAKLLEGKSIDQVYEIAADLLEMGVDELKGRYAHLNPGHQRMCVGNKLRGIV